MKLLIALLALVFPVVGVAQQSGSPGGADERFDDVQHWVERFESAERGRWQKPSLVFQLLALREGQTVADLGAGTGLFAHTLAHIVGETGKVYAVDIEPRMLEYIRNRDDLPEFDNLQTVLATPDDPKLPHGEIDVVLCVNTWHHIDKRVKYLKRRIEPALAPGGRFVLVDFHAGELPVGPPPDQKLSREQAIAEFEKAGWVRASESVAFPYQYFIVFAPPRERHLIGGE